MIKFHGLFPSRLSCFHLTAHCRCETGIKKGTENRNFTKSKNPALCFLLLMPAFLILIIFKVTWLPPAESGDHQYKKVVQEQIKTNVQRLVPGKRGGGPWCLDISGSQSFKDWPKLLCVLKREKCRASKYSIAQRYSIVTLLSPLPPPKDPIKCIHVSKLVCEKGLRWTKCGMG